MHKCNLAALYLSYVACLSPFALCYLGLELNPVQQSLINGHRCLWANAALNQWATEWTVPQMDNAQAHSKEHLRSTCQDPSPIAHSGINSTQECHLAWPPLHPSSHFPQSEAQISYLPSSPYFRLFLGAVGWSKCR